MSLALFLVLVACIVATFALCGNAKDLDRRQDLGEGYGIARRLRLDLDADLAEVISLRERAARMHADQLRRNH